MTLYFVCVNKFFHCEVGKTHFSFFSSFADLFSGASQSPYLNRKPLNRVGGGQSDATRSPESTGWVLRGTDLQKSDKVCQNAMIKMTDNKRRTSISEPLLGLLVHWPPRRKRREIWFVLLFTERNEMNLWFSWERQLVLSTLSRGSERCAHRPGVRLNDIVQMYIFSRTNVWGLFVLILRFSSHCQYSQIRTSWRRHQNNPCVMPTQEMVRPLCGHIQ